MNEFLISTIQFKIICIALFTIQSLQSSFTGNYIYQDLYTIKFLLVKMLILDISNTFPLVIMLIRDINNYIFTSYEANA